MKQLSKEQLRTLIKQKWGTISRFILESGLPAKKVRSSLHRDIPSAVSYRRVIQKDAEEGTPIIVTGVDLTPEVSEKIRVAIYTQYKSVEALIEAHPDLTSSFVSNVINQKRKKLDSRVKALAEILNVEL